MYIKSVPSWKTKWLSVALLSDRTDPIIPFVYGKVLFILCVLDLSFFLFQTGFV